jgi:hypothetical protein
MEGSSNIVFKKFPQNTYIIRVESKFCFNYIFQYLTTKVTKINYSHYKWCEGDISNPLRISPEIELEFRNVNFYGRKTGGPAEKPPWQGREPTNSTHMKYPS